MYGNLVKKEPQPLPSPRTPASTVPFVQRTVRTLSRFKRDVHEGYLEDMLVDPHQLEDEDFLAKAMEDSYGELLRSFNVTNDDREVLKSIIYSKWGVNNLNGRVRRQAGFPGSNQEDDNK